MSSFELPEMFISPEFSWGPPEEEMMIDGEPFNLYFKSDALQAFDWYAPNREDDDDDESDTSDRRGKKTGKAVQFKVVADDVRLKALKNERAKTAHKPFNRKTYTQRRPNFFGNRSSNRQVNELPSTVNVTPDTVVYADHAQSDLQKLQLEHMPVVSDIASHGQPLLYNTAMDAATCSHPVKLDETNMDPEYYQRPIPTADPVLREIIKSQTDKHMCFVTTDEVLALLMTSGRSICPWHINVLRIGSKPLIFLSNDDSSNADMQWVSETAGRDNRPSEDDPQISERISSLGEESTLAHEAFLRAACTRSRAQVKVNKNPFPKTQPRMYRYRRFTMHQGTPDRYDIIVRCDVDAMTPKNEAVRLFGLVEQRVEGKANEWATTLASKASALIPIEYRQNACKISRWTALSFLSDANTMKIGFIRRAQKPKGATKDAADKKDIGNPKEHQVVSVQSNNPLSLATQLGISANNMWAVVDSILQTLITHPEYDEAMIVKPGGKPEVLLVEPIEESDDEEDDDDDDDDDDEDGDDEDEGDE